MSSRLERIVLMDEVIRRGGYPTVDKFCEMFEVQKRTIYEDIRIMKERMHMEIEFDRFHNGYINKNPKKQLPSFELTDGEVFALTLGKKMLSEYTGTSFETILRSALEKIYQRLPDKVQIDPEDLKYMVKFDAGPVLQISHKMFLDLNRACEKNIPMDMEYFTVSRGEMTKRMVDPYRLLEHRGTWYLVAYCHMRKALRTFALHRIQNYALRDERFTPWADEEIQSWLDKAFFLEHAEQEHRVTIKFDPRAARYIRERKWHPSQQLVEHDDGGCTLSFTTASVEEAKRWILTFGPQAQVLDPPFFKELVVNELRGALDRYNDKK